MTIYGLVLAGGAGSRLGHVHKATLRLGGKTMMERVAERLGGCSQPLLVSTGPDCGPIKAGMALPDPSGPRAGPLAGIAAAVRHLRGRANADDVLVTAAVDTPFLPQTYVSRLVEALTGNDAVYSVWQDYFYPTNAAFRLGALFALDSPIGALASPKRLLQELGAEPVDWSGSADDPFANLNTLDDLVALTRRLE